MRAATFNFFGKPPRSKGETSRFLDGRPAVAMTHHLQAALANSTSDALVQTLGGVAAVALLFTLAAIGAIFVKERENCRRRFRAAERKPATPESIAALSRDVTTNEDIRRLTAEVSRLRDETLKNGAPLLRDLALKADEALSAIAASYGELGRDGRAAANPRTAHCRAVCESQWTSFRSELAYLGFSELQAHLRHVLDNCRIGGGSSCSAGTDLDASPDALRAQEVAGLAQGIARQRVMALQEAMLEGVKPFREYYDGAVKVWINDRIFRLVHRLGDRTPKGLLLRETGLKDKLAELRNQLEIAARLSERLAINVQGIGDPDLAFSQVVFVGMMLSILSRLPEWMPDLPGAPLADEAPPAPESATASAVGA